MEETFRKDFAPLIPYSGKGLEPKDFFSLADELGRLRSQIHNLEHWEQIESQMIAPHINQALQVTARHLNQDKAADWQNWQTRYVSKLLLLLKIMRQEAAKKSEQHLQSVTTTLDRSLPEEKREEPLSRKALWCLTSTPGVTCVLNGIRTTDYVEDSLTILGWEPLQNPRAIFESMKAH